MYDKEYCYSLKINTNGKKVKCLISLEVWWLQIEKYVDFFKSQMSLDYIFNTLLKRKVKKNSKVLAESKLFYNFWEGDVAIWKFTSFSNFAYRNLYYGN